MWLADGVYATHGHYLDLHMTMPTLERVIIAASARLTLDGRRRWDDVHSPADYEAVIGPPYAWVDAAAQSERASQAVIGGRTVAAWNALRPGRGRRPLRARAFATAFPVAVRALNAAGPRPPAQRALAGRAAHARACVRSARSPNASRSRPSTCCSDTPTAPARSPTTSRPNG